MAEVETPLSSKRLSLIIITVGMIFLAGYPIISVASTTATGHAWQLIGVVNFSNAGDNNHVFNSTFKGSVGIGLNITIPNPSWMLPFAFKQCAGQNCFTNILLFITGWVVIHIGSPNSSTAVIFTVGPVISTAGIPAIGQPIGAIDDAPTGATGSAFGPANPLHVSTGTRFQNSFTLPINAYREVGCLASGQCINIGSLVFVFLQINCGTFFTGSGGSTANSCHFWGKGVNGWDLGNATLGAGRLQVFA